MASTNFYLMMTNLGLEEPFSRFLLHEWFPLHFFQGPLPTLAVGFYVAESHADVLEILLKVQLFSGVATLLAEEDEFIRLLGQFSEADRIEVDTMLCRGRSLTVDSWRSVMRLATELEAADDLAMDLGREVTGQQEEDNASAYYTANEGDAMSVDSDSDDGSDNGEVDDGDDDNDDNDDEREDDEVSELLDLVPLYPPFNLAEYHRMDTAFREQVKLCLHEEHDLPFASSYGCLI